MHKCVCALRILGAVSVGVFCISLLFGADRAIAATADDVALRVDDLQKAITDYDGKGEVSADKIKALITSLFDKKVVGLNAPAYFEQASIELKKMLDDEKLRQTIQSNAKAAEAAKNLLAAMDQLTPDAFVRDRFTDLLSKLTSLINASISNRAVLESALSEPGDAAVKKARADFDTQWARVADNTLKIHVIQAKFGDLRTKDKEGRLCAATLAMKSRCEEKAECSLKGMGTPAPGKPFDQEALCGYDPAPLVEMQYKGVDVEFACIPGGQATWDSVARYPGTDPATKKPWDKKDISKETLSSPEMTIRCPYPVPEKSGG